MKPSARDENASLLRTLSRTSPCSGRQSVSSASARSRISAYDLWLSPSVARNHGIELLALDDVLSSSRCVFVTAVPTSENYHLLNAERLARLSDSALLVLLSRAHLVDFDALESELETRRIRACIDVFPSEPISPGAAIRKQKAAILSPHRAAAVHRGRQLIGDLILSDLRSIEMGRQERKLSRASQTTIEMLEGQGMPKSCRNCQDARIGDRLSAKDFVLCFRLSVPFAVVHYGSKPRSYNARRSC